MICLSQQLFAQVAPVWPKLEQQMKPWTRWWWMGNAVDQKNLNRVLVQYQQAGIGGVEITPIYGAVGYEQRYLKFLSPDWMNMLNYTLKRSQELGMGVDMNTGTGWPFGGPQVKPEQAATKLIVQQYELKAGEQLKEPVKVQEAKQEVATLQALTAYGPAGQILNLLDKVGSGGQLNWKPEKGDWRLYAAFAGKTRQQVKRAAPGGEGLTVDHLDKVAVDQYLARFNTAFSQQPKGLRAFFNDSYEVYGANWTPTFFQEFQKRRGYDLKSYIKELTGKDTLSADVARLKSDYRETMSDLLLENFTQNWSKWAGKYQALTRNQSHGSPGNLLDLYAAVGIPETETFGSSHFPIPGLRRDSADVRNVDPDPMMSKFASSAAHLSGKNLVSSETFTWLTEHFKTSFSQCKPEVEQLFLSGVNHVFYHGTTNSPEDAVWPGWLFYASVEFNANNSLWPQMSGLNNYISRCQSILQAGKSDNELLIYWPIYDAWNNAKGMDMAIKVHNVDEWLHPTAFYQLSKKLSKIGYSFDFASERQIAQSIVNQGQISTAPTASPYKAIVFPSSQLMSVETLEKAIQLAREGATVIFQELPQDVPGLGNLESRRAKLKQLLGSLRFSDVGSGVQKFAIGKGMVLLSASVENALSFKAIRPESLTEQGIQFIRRHIAGGKYYYLVNHTAKDIDAQISLNAEGEVVMMDPQSGQYGRVISRESDGKRYTRIQLRSGEAMVLKVGARQGSIPDWTYLDNVQQAIKLNRPWDLTFIQGGPTLPAQQKLDQLVSWTELSDPDLKSFSGTGVYSSTFKLEQKVAKEYVLNLNKVDESARVWINGQEVGTLWSIPFQARVGKFLRAGENTIKIEVVNLMANRIRDLDLRKIQWRNYHEINFVNINYKPFDASKWEVVPSGLIGPVTITPYH